MKTLVATALALCLLAAPAGAALYQIDFSFATTGSPNPATGSVTIDNDFDSDVPPTSMGLTVNALNFDVDPGLNSQVAYRYDFGSDALRIGGVANGPGGIAINTNDFQLTIDEFLTGPQTAVALLTQGAGFIAVNAITALNITEPGADVYQIDFSFETIGTPNPATGSVTIGNEFVSDVPGTVIGLTINALNFDVDSGLNFQVAYQYDFGSDVLRIGGVANGPGGISVNTYDFQVTIDDFLTGFPPTGVAMLVQGAGFIAFDAITTLNINEIPDDTGVVPLPATLPLVLTALGLLGLMRRVGPRSTLRAAATRQ